jgi:hypothetical protein
MAILIGAAVAACSQQGAPSAQAHPSTSTATLPTSAACPLAVEGAHIDVAETQDGVILTITARADRVDELRRRVRDAAALHGIGAHEGLGHYGRHLGHQRHGLELTRLPPVETAVEDVEHGARLRLVAIVPSQVDAVREQVREKVERVNAGPCD